MAPPPIRLTASQRDDLAAACAVGAAGLERIAARLVTEKPTIRRSRIEAVIRGEVENADQADAIAHLLFGIAGSFRRSATTAAELLDRLGAAIEAAAAEDKRLAGWQASRPALERLLTDRSVALAAKALDVSYDFERVFLAGRLLTSMRPVFDESRENIVGSAIVQTLRLEYIAQDGDQSSISIALDADDIKQLKLECERALSKAAIVKSKIEHDCAIEAIIPGEEQ